MLTGQHFSVPHVAQLHCVLEMIQKNWGMVMNYDRENEACKKTKNLRKHTR